jgi:cell shape-determining protein MreD
MILKSTKDKIKEIIAGFESLHGISYILDVIYGSHIPIVAFKVIVMTFLVQECYGSPKKQEF